MAQKDSKTPKKTPTARKPTRSRGQKDERPAPDTSLTPRAIEVALKYGKSVSEGIIAMDAFVREKPDPTQETLRMLENLETLKRLQELEKMLQGMTIEIKTTKDTLIDAQQAAKTWIGTAGGTSATVDYDQIKKIVQGGTNDVVAMVTGMLERRY